MIKAILQAVRANAQATVEMVDGLLQTIDALEKEEREAAIPRLDYSGATCTHPENARRPVPRMGSPLAYVCGLCGHAGGTDEASAGAAAPDKEG